MTANGQFLRGGFLRGWFMITACMGSLPTSLCAETEAVPSSPAPAVSSTQSPPHVTLPPLSVYGQLPGFENAAISPSGKRVAIVGRLNDARYLIVYDHDSKKPLITSPLGDTKIRGIYWGGDERVLLHKTHTTSLGFGFTSAKAELSAMVVIPLNGGKAYQIFQGDNRITGGIRGFHGVVQRGGKYYGYFGGITYDRSSSMENGHLTNTDPVLYEVDLDTGRAHKIADRTSDPLNWRDWLIDGNGVVQATLDYSSAQGRWSIRNTAGQKIVEGVNPLGGISLIGFGAQPGTLIYSVEDEAKDRSETWLEIPLAGGSAKPVLPDVGIRRSYFDNRTRTFLGYEVEGDTPAYTFSDPRYQKATDATGKAFPGSSVHLIDWDDDFNRLIVMTEGPNDPQNWWTIDLTTRHADPLGTAYPIDQSAVGPMRMIRYKAADGMEIPAVLTLPPGRKTSNLPVILLPHGGPTARDYPGFDWWAQALASRGYAVLQPNFRGSSGYGASFIAAGHGEWGRKMQSDISDGLAWLVKEGIADPKRACIMGASYGGYAALAGITLQKNLYRCAVVVAGVSDVAKMASTDISESGDNEMVKRALRAEVGVRRDLRAISPINFAAQADAPVLLIHGKDDIVVLYDQSADMASALRRAGKPVEFLTLPGEDHWLSKSSTRLAMLEAAVAFVEKHNPPDPLP